jgi:hypothetical protein
MATAEKTKSPSRAAAAMQREKLRIERRKVWIDFIDCFVPNEGAFERVPTTATTLELSCDPSVKDALHRALIAACDALEAEAIHDVRRYTLRRGKEADSAKGS